MPTVMLVHFCCLLQLWGSPRWTNMQLLVVLRSTLSEYRSCSTLYFVCFPAAWKAQLKRA